MAYFSKAVCECCRYLPDFFPDILHQLQEDPAQVKLLINGEFLCALVTVKTCPAA